MHIPYNLFQILLDAPLFSKDGLLGICLGERRRLLVEDRNLWNKFAEILPDILDEFQTFLDVEVTGVNEATWSKHSSGNRVN